MLPTITLSVAVGLIEPVRECLYAKHGGLVRSITCRSWSGLSDPRLMGLTSASLVVWHRSSSPTLKNCLKYCTEVYRPLRKSTVPIFDRDTDPYRFRLSIKFSDLPTLLPEGARIRSTPFSVFLSCAVYHAAKRWGERQPRLSVAPRLSRTRSTRIRHTAGVGFSGRLARI